MPHQPPPPANLLGQEAVGQRVSVRLLAGGQGPSGGPAMRDVVGVLEAIEPAATEVGGRLPDQWVVRRRDGSTERLSVDLMVAAIVVPPATARIRRAQDIGVEDLEAIAARGWQPLDRSTVGDWVLRASVGFTGRANSVLPLGSPGVNLGEALESTRRWYAERDLPARFQLPLPSSAELDRALSARGWTGYNPTLVLVADLEQVRLASGDRMDLPTVDLVNTPDEEWLRVYNYRGRPLPSIAREVMVNAELPVFASVREQNESGSSIIAVARAAITDHWVGVTAVYVSQSARRRGFATHAMKGLFDYANIQGARHVYVQVAEENRPALAMYDKLGFAVHHRYHYRVAPSSENNHTT